MSNVGSRRRLAWVVVGSIVGGLLAGIAVVALVVPGAEEHLVTGSLLVVFGLGWASLALLSDRFADRPQQWARVPAAFMLSAGLGLLVLAPGRGVMDALGWLWPPALAVLGVWSIRQARQHLDSRTRPWLVYPVCAVLVLGGVGGSIATVREAVASEPAPPNGGQLVDVGGRLMYLTCVGSGGPTVVLQAGLWESSADWDLVTPGVSQAVQVCAYDRAGRGSSEPPPEPQDGRDIAVDLHTLLREAGVEGPYVLVGYSSGGPYVRAHAAEYPEDVAGVVFLDAQPVEAFSGLPAYPSFYSQTKVVMGLLPTLGRMGVMRVTVAESLRTEFVQLPDALDQGAALTSLGDLPLIVVTAEKGAMDGWLPLQDDMAGLSTNSVHRVLRGVTHASLIHDDGGAASAARAILDLVDSIRTGTSLADS